VVLRRRSVTVRSLVLLLLSELVKVGIRVRNLMSVSLLLQSNDSTRAVSGSVLHHILIQEIIFERVVLSPVH